MLQGIGAWLKKYGKSIYGTRGGPFKPTKSMVSTRKDKTIFVHVLRWDGDVIKLPAIQGKIVSAKVLTGGKVEVHQQADGISLRVVPEHRQEIDTVVAVRLNDRVVNEHRVFAN